MKRVLRVLLKAAVFLGILGALVWLGACAWLSRGNPRVVFSEQELARPAAPLPAGFLWGAATSAHQIEGGNCNDWTRFEAQPGRIEAGETSAIAADGWNRMLEDIGLLKQLKANAYRFSIEWSRLEPREGQWDEAAWAHYVAFTRSLRAQGMTPMVTLMHFTLPIWMSDRGGLVAPDFPERFARFAAEASRRLGDQADLWITFNEPNVMLVQGYMFGTWPPFKQARTDTSSAFQGLLRAHAAAAKALHSRAGAQVGMAHNLMWVEPRSRWVLTDWAAAAFLEGFWNWGFADAIHTGRARFRMPGLALDEPIPDLKGSTDFFGLNYYFHYTARMAPGTASFVSLRPGPGLQSEVGGDPPPGDSPAEGLYVLLGQAWKRYRMPIYITEGGIADSQGKLRGPLIRGQRHAIDRALAEGVPVKAYLHWSLMDNFEWEHGYRPRFGLFRVDRQTLDRTPDPAAQVFAELAP